MNDTELPAIGHLSLESKRKLFELIVNELLGPRHFVSIPGLDRDFVISSHLKNEKEIVEEVIRNRTPEEWAELRRRANDSEDHFMSFEEVLNLSWDDSPASN